MTTTHRKRLNKLADFLESLPPRKFDMAKWWGDGDGLATDPEPTCSTVACALGWATTIPSFRRAGLRMWRGSPVVDEYIVFGVTDAYMVLGVTAGAQFFGLTYDRAIDLFMPSGYRSRNPRPKTVAKRLRKLAEES